MSQTISDTALGIIADWWFDKFLLPKHDNGDRGSVPAVAGMMSGLLASRHPVEESQRKTFKSELVTRCRAEAHLSGQTLSVDYHPVGVLKAAMDAANIDESRSSWKTDVYFHGREVSVGAGYGVPQEILCYTDGAIPDERWTHRYESEGRALKQYAYSEYAHHGQIAIMWRYHGTDHPYTSTHERLVDGQWIAQESKANTDDCTTPAKETSTTPEDD